MSENLNPVQLLVEALRSGEYKQGELTLCYNDENNKKRHCCLGVACEIYQKHVGDLSIDKRGNKYSYDHATYDLPDKVREWYGFENSSGGFSNDINIGNKSYRSLIGMNDDLISFKVISDVIESGKVTTIQEGLKNEG